MRRRVGSTSFAADVARFVPTPRGVDEALEAGLDGSQPLTVHAKMLRLELLKVKADLERELETWSLNCTKCGIDVHWVGGLGITPGYWGHREPTPDGEPTV